jgi:hypothetical protein
VRTMHDLRIIHKQPELDSDAVTMDVKPSKGLKVKVSAAREAIFGEDGVEVKKVTTPSGKKALGTMTGRTLVGYAEVEMETLDGGKHWYPVDQLATEKGEKVVEEEIPVEIPAEEKEESSEEEEEE